MSDQDKAGKEFWVVWNGVRNGLPLHRHGSLANAQAEAMRLAGLHPGTTFYVLKATNAYAAEVEIKPVFLDSAAGEA